MIFQATLTETNEWVPYVYLLDVADLAVGYDPETGDLGLYNQQGQDLANRTAFLKALFESEHSPEGMHSVTNAQVASSAGIQESKLSLDHPTATLHSSIEDLLVQAASTRALLDEVRSDSFDFHDAVSKAIPLSWIYSNKYFDFELFLPNGDLSLRNTNVAIDVLNAIAGDDSIDVASTEALVPGRSYVVYDTDSVASYLVTVLSVLSDTRFRCTETFPVNMTSGKVAGTSWVIPADGNYALAKNNSYLVTRPIKGLTDYASGKVIIRCNNTPCEITVQSRAVSGAGSWAPCVLSDTAARENGYIDYEFTCPGGDIELSFMMATTSPASEVLVKNICVMPVSAYLLSDDVRQPECVTPAQGSANVGETPTLTGSTYYSLYGVPQGAAQFQVSLDQNFGTLVFNKTVTGDTTSTAVIAGAISPDMAYFWRCRYKDAEGAWSKWSEPAQFTTKDMFLSIATPINASPGSGQRNIGMLGCQLTCSAFRVIGGGTDSHESSQWQISTDPAFQNITHDSGVSTTAKTYYTIPFGVLDTSTYYYWRVKHKGTLIGWSHWSTITRFETTSLETSIAPPTAMSPTFGAERLSISTTSLKSSNFAITNGTDTHEMSQWQVYNTADFEADPAGHLVFGSGYTAASLTTCQLPEGTLQYETKYFWRVRHKGALIGWSDWSALSEFTTITRVSVATPSNVSPEAGTSEVSTINPVLAASAFVAINAPAESHKYSEWEISRTASFASNYVVYQSGVTNTDLTAHKVLSRIFNVGDTYFWRVRYTGVTAGTSSWSEPTAFTTALAASIATPAAIEPAAGATKLNYERITFHSSDFAVENVDSIHEATQWQISTDVGFNTVVWDSGALSASTYQTFDFNVLTFSTQYYWRVRYRGTLIGWSSWSPAALFTTDVKKQIVVPSIVAPANNATNFPKYGAYVTGSPFNYAGSLAQHASSRWVVATYNASKNEYTAIYSETTTGNSLLSFLIPNSKLSYGGEYHVRVQYKATDNEWSEYSPWSKFTVATAKKFFQYFVSENDTSIESVTTDAQGNVYYAVRCLAVPSTGKYNTAIYKYNKNNALGWKKVFNDVSFFKLVYSQETGSLICAGAAHRGYGASQRPALMKLAPDASVVWSKYVHYTGSDTPAGQFVAAYELPGGEIVCAGKTGSRSLVAGFYANGSVKWSASITNFDFFNDISYAQDTIAFVGTKTTGEATSDGTLYLTKSSGPTNDDIGSLYAFSSDNAGVAFNAAWMHPTTKDVYVGGRMKHKSIFGKFSSASKDFAFVKRINDGPDSATVASATPTVTNPGISFYRDYHDPGSNKWIELGRREIALTNAVNKVVLSGTFYSLERETYFKYEYPDYFYTAVDVYLDGVHKATWASPQYTTTTYNWSVTLDSLAFESGTTARKILIVARYIQNHHSDDKLTATCSCNYMALYSVGSTLTQEYSNIASLAKDPYSNHLYACGYSNSARCAATLYKFDLDGKGMWGRYLEAANTNFGFFDKLNALTYSVAHQAVIAGGSFSNNSKYIYSTGGNSIYGFRYGVATSIMPDANGASFTSGAAAPNTLRMSANQGVFPSNATFPNVSVARSAKYAPEHVALNYYTSVQALNIVYTNTDYAVSVNGPYSY